MLYSIDTIKKGRNWALEFVNNEYPYSQWHLVMYGYMCGADMWFDEEPKDLNPHLEYLWSKINDRAATTESSDINATENETSIG